ncbi:11109_t:CDS:1, partial [Cetraspora pellucida]
KNFDLQGDNDLQKIFELSLKEFLVKCQDGKVDDATCLLFIPLNGENLQEKLKKITKDAIDWNCFFPSIEDNSCEEFEPITSESENENDH